MNQPRSELVVAESLAGGREESLSPRETILLWVANARFKLDDLEAFEYVFSQPLAVEVEGRTLGVDGVIVDPSGGDPEVTLLLYRFGADPRQVNQELDALSQIGSSAKLLRLIAGASAEVVGILDRAKLAPTDVRLEVRLVVIAPESRLRRPASTTSPSIEILDQRRLDGLKNAVEDPGPVLGTRKVDIRPGEGIETVAGRYRIAIAVVDAKQILEWPEIESRQLFDLNVRLGLGMNRVRRSLDEAFSTGGGQPEILAYHNGLTVLTNRLKVTPHHIELDGVSVVNGAQTLLALFENRVTVSKELRFLVKFVEIKSVLEDAQEIAVRSNSQNPVTSRNLRALDETQLRLRRELVEHGLDYETRPDRSKPTSSNVLKNDEVAQWLCAIYLEEPWLAVKRTSLFLAENYARVFPPDLDVDRVLFATKIRRTVESHKQDLPAAYHRAWSLSALTCCYLVGQALRSSATAARILLMSTADEQVSPAVTELLDAAMAVTAEVLKKKNTADLASNAYYVDFKSKQALLQLAAEVTRSSMASGSGL